MDVWTARLIETGIAGAFTRRSIPDVRLRCALLSTGTHHSRSVNMARIDEIAYCEADSSGTRCDREQDLPSLVPRMAKVSGDVSLQPDIGRYPSFRHVFRCYPLKRQ